MKGRFLGFFRISPRRGVLLMASAGFASAVAFASPAPRNASPAPAGSPSASSRRAEAPDPPVTSTKRKWVYDVVYRDGAFSVGPPVLVERDRPFPTPRILGRFAVELYIGRQLLERVRFDLPLLNDVEPGEPLLPPNQRPFPDFSAKARVHRRVEVPDIDRATYAVLVDRATGQRRPLFWPPVDELGRQAAGSASVIASTTSPLRKP